MDVTSAMINDSIKEYISSPILNVYIVVFIKLCIFIDHNLLRQNHISEMGNGRQLIKAE